MSLSRFFYEPFYEPFYSLSDFDRLFDEAFSARSNGNGGQVQRRDTQDRSLRPRSVDLTVFNELPSRY